MNFRLDSIDMVIIQVFQRKIRVGLCSESLDGFLGRRWNKRCEGSRLVRFQLVYGRVSKRIRKTILLVLYPYNTVIISSSFTVFL